MTIRPEDITDTYADGRLLRQWRLVCGVPECADNAVAVTDPAADAIRAANQVVRATVTELVAYERATALLAQHPEAPPSGTPERTDWDAARVTADTASAKTRALVVLRGYRAGAPPVRFPDGQPNPEYTIYRNAVAVVQQEIA